MRIISNCVHVFVSSLTTVIYCSAAYSKIRLTTDKAPHGLAPVNISECLFPCSQADL